MIYQKEFDIRIKYFLNEEIEKYCSWKSKSPGKYTNITFTRSWGKVMASSDSFFAHTSWKAKMGLRRRWWWWLSVNVSEPQQRRATKRKKIILVIIRWDKNMKDMTSHNFHGHPNLTLDSLNLPSQSFQTNQLKFFFFKWTMAVAKVVKLEVNLCKVGRRRRRKFSFKRVGALHHWPISRGQKIYIPIL